MTRAFPPRPVAALLIVAALTLGASGCYQLGYEIGFGSDSWYFAGYDDSWFTINVGPIRFSSGNLSAEGDGDFSAGLLDGAYFAYIDGYFAAYRDAFIIGFSEGYDNAFWSDYIDFFSGDRHVEYEHGGFIDGYHDGFSEGRVFGAYDYSAGLPFDWLDAFLDWQRGTDLFLEEVNVGTGPYGPVLFYQWGTDPSEAKSAERRRHPLEKYRDGLRGDGAKDFDDSFVRPLDDERREILNVLNEVSLRSNRPLDLTMTWLERVEAVNDPE